MPGVRRVFLRVLQGGFGEWGEGKNNPSGDVIAHGGHFEDSLPASQTTWPVPGPLTGCRVRSIETDAAVGPTQMKRAGPHPLLSVSSRYCMVILQFYLRIL